MGMSNPDSHLDIEEIIGNEKPQFIPIDKCITGSIQMRQSGTSVKEDDKLVEQIRKLKGLLHPIIVKKKSDEEYEILVGQRRAGAYHILKKEDSRYKKIKAYVITHDLEEDEKRVISFIENFGRDEPPRSDYINVIEYFYTKYNRNLSAAARALGIKRDDAKRYLTRARLSDRVNQHIDNKDFSIDIAMEALRALGDDESSADDDILIETATELKKLKPVVRKATVKKMKATKRSVKEIINDSSVPQHEVKIMVTDSQRILLTQYKDKHYLESEQDAAVAAMDMELLRDLG